jgi:hypothetical protein
MNERMQAIDSLALLMAQLSWHLDSEQVLKELEEGANLDVMREWVDQLLSHSGPGGRLAIVRDKGGLPENPFCFRDSMETQLRRTYARAQQDMLEAGWVQEVKE